MVRKESKQPFSFERLIERLPSASDEPARSTHCQRRKGSSPCRVFSAVTIRLKSGLVLRMLLQSVRKLLPCNFVSANFFIKLSVVEGTKIPTEHVNTSKVSSNIFGNREVVCSCGCEILYNHFVKDASKICTANFDNCSFSSSYIFCCS